MLRVVYFPWFIFSFFYWARGDEAFVADFSDSMNGEKIKTASSLSERMGVFWKWWSGNYHGVRKNCMGGKHFCMGGGDGRKCRMLFGYAFSSRARVTMFLCFCFHCLRKMGQCVVFQRVFGEGKWRQNESGICNSLCVSCLSPFFAFTGSCSRVFVAKQWREVKAKPSFCFHLPSPHAVKNTHFRGDERRKSTQRTDYHHLRKQNFFLPSFAFTGTTWFSKIYSKKRRQWRQNTNIREMRAHVRAKETNTINQERFNTTSHVSAPTSEGDISTSYLNATNSLVYFTAWKHCTQNEVQKLWLILFVRRSVRIFAFKTQ